MEDLIVVVVVVEKEIVIILLLLLLVLIIIIVSIFSRSSAARRERRFVWEGNISSHAFVRASGKALGRHLLDAAGDAPGTAARLVEAERAAEGLEVGVRLAKGELVGADLAPALDALASGFPRATERAATVASCRTA